MRFQTPIVSVKGPTAEDWPGKLAFTLNVPGCEMGCSFCFSKALWSRTQPLMDDEEVWKKLRRWNALSDQAIVFGGADPLSQPLRRLMQDMTELKDLGYSIGVFATPRHPATLRALTGAGLLSYIHLSLLTSDSLHPSIEDTRAASTLDILERFDGQRYLNVTVTDRTEKEVLPLKEFAARHTSEHLYVTQALMID